MATFRQIIKQVYTQLSKKPTLNSKYDGIGFPISTERNLAYMFFGVRYPEKDSPFNGVTNNVEYRQARTESARYLKRAVETIIDAFNVDGSFTPKDIYSKIDSVKRTMIYPDWRKHIKYYLENVPRCVRDLLLKPSFYAIEGIPSNIGILNIYVRYSDSYINECAEIYVEILGSEKKASKNTTFTKVPSIKVGSILKGSWGYSMTIVDFYEVIKRTESFLYIKKLNSETIRDDGPQGEMIMPIPGEYSDGTLYRTKIQGNDTNFFCKSPKYGILTLWDGTPEYQNTWD